jgi:HD-like signal output (HDOD) protein/CheY-like chemotaxis protein
MPPDTDAPETGTKNILFVDDEPAALESVRAEIAARTEWNVTFVQSGEEALAELGSCPSDVVVSDMRMPGMDGAALLAQVQELYTDTVRLVVSSDSEPATLARAGAVAHRLLAKPVDTDELLRVIKRSLVLGEMRRRADLFGATIGVASLPARPGIYVELITELGNPRSGPDDLARIVEQDGAMSAKILQLANSAFFGNGRDVVRVRDAVIYLGANTLKGLTLSAEAFARFKPQLVPAGFDVKSLRRHSALVARLAGAMVPPGRVRDDAVTAALLHDIGQLVLATNASDYFADILSTALLEQRAMAEVERDRSGVTHAEIGAHLLDLWGLPHGIVEAVAYHEDPSPLSTDQGLDAVAVVHIADRLASELVLDKDEEDMPAKPIDPEYIAALGVGDRIDGWRRAAVAMVDEVAMPA